jgi:multidrug resistance efflux pump
VRKLAIGWPCRDPFGGSQQNVDQQQTKVDQLKASIEADDAAIATAQTQMDYTTISAPSDGRIGVRQVDPGNLVRSTATSIRRRRMCRRRSQLLARRCRNR